MSAKTISAPFGHHELAIDEKAVISTAILPHPNHPDSADLIAYWQDCADRGGLQLGRDLPSTRAAKLMSRLIVFQPIDQGKDFRIRLAGTGLLRRFGHDISGKLLSEVYDGPTFDNYRGNLLATLTTGTPLLLDVRIVEGPNEIFHIEYAFLPVMSYGGNEIWVVTGAFYFN